jgi:type I restriction enzyme S subunit
MGNIVNGRLDFNELKYLPKAHSEFPELLLEPGDVLFNRTNSPELVGKTAVYDDTHPHPCSFASYLIRLKFRSYEPRLFAAYLNSPFGRAWIRSCVSQQVGQANVSGGKLKDLEIPVPPPDEQRCIVVKLQSLRARSLRAEDTLDAVPPLIESLRQSILAAAFRGDLTKDWRAKQKDVEPARKLLERIRTERRQKWEAAEVAKMKALGRVPADDRWKSKYVAPTPLGNVMALATLPPGWVWARFAEVATIASNLVQPRDYPNLAHVAPDNIERDTGRLINCRTVAEDAVKSSNHHFVSGQILYSKIRPYLNKCAIAPSDGLCSADMYPIDSHVHCEYLHGYMLSSAFLAEIAQRAGSRVVLPKANQDQLNDVIVPIAPYAEQRAISSSIRSALAHCDSISSALTATRAQLSTLDATILAKAFQGQLI